MGYNFRCKNGCTLPNEHFDRCSMPMDHESIMDRHGPSFSGLCKCGESFWYCDAALLRAYIIVVADHTCEDRAADKRMCDCE